MNERLLVTETTDAFLWIVIVSAFGAFFAAFGIGANDVANAFATSVGAKAITLKQAVVLAGIFEFFGAVFLGSHVTKTIRNGIAEISCFEDNPPIFMYGMMCVVYSTGMWVLIASFLELPVSTTHSTVGGIVGMALTYRGSDCVVWHEATDVFPFVKGISAIVVSWFISPIFSAVLTALLFLIVRTLVLRPENSYNRAFFFYPLLVAATLSINVFFIVYKGTKGLDLDEVPLSTAFAWALGLGFSIGILMVPTVLPIMRKRVDIKFNEDGTLKAPFVERKDTTKTPALIGFVNRQINKDVHSSALNSECVSTIHSTAEKFDVRSEEVFKYVQVFTAICDSFSHGANDVANAMGPFAAVYIVYVDHVGSSSHDLDNDAYWILALGGLGISVGLALYGWKIISAIGVKICKITPSRGFAIELGSAMVVIIGSRLEIPLSTTHCQVGATTGVALLEGSGGLNTPILFKIICGWIVTVFICGVTSSVLFAQGAYAPYVYDTIELTEVA